MSENIYDIYETQLPPATKKPCDQCPWRREAMPGFLGPHGAKEWAEMAHDDIPIMCHKTLRHGQHDFDDPEIRQCRGAAIFRANIHKRPRNPTAETGPRDTKTVFSWDNEFIDHHEGGA